MEGEEIAITLEPTAEARGWRPSWKLHTQHLVISSTVTLAVEAHRRTIFEGSLKKKPKLAAHSQELTKVERGWAAVNIAIVIAWSDCQKVTSR